MSIIDFFCDKYFLKFGIRPIRVGREDRFKIGKEEKTLDDIEKAIYPKKRMTGEVKEKLKGYSRTKEEVRKRAKELLKGKKGIFV